MLLNGQKELSNRLYRKKNNNHVHHLLLMIQINVVLFTFKNIHKFNVYKKK